MIDSARGVGYPGIRRKEGAPAKSGNLEGRRNFIIYASTPNIFNDEKTHVDGNQRRVLAMAADTYMEGDSGLN